MSEQTMRDPRVEPRAGDVVRDRINCERRVLRVHARCVDYQERASSGSEWHRWPYMCFLTEWQRDNANATVVNVSEG